MYTRLPLKLIGISKLILCLMKCPVPVQFFALKLEYLETKYINMMNVQLHKNITYVFRCQIFNNSQSFATTVHDEILLRKVKTRIILYLTQQIIKYIYFTQSTYFYAVFTNITVYLFVHVLFNTVFFDNI